MKPRQTYEEYRAEARQGNSENARRLADLLEEAAERIAPLGVMSNITDSDLRKRLRKEAKAARAFIGQLAHKKHLEHLDDERKRAAGVSGGARS